MAFRVSMDGKNWQTVIPEVLQSEPMEHIVVLTYKGQGRKTKAHVFTGHKIKLTFHTDEETGFIIGKEYEFKLPSGTEFI